MSFGGASGAGARPSACRLRSSIRLPGKPATLRNPSCPSLSLHPLHLPHSSQLASFQEAISRHSAVPETVMECIRVLPHDTHPMACILVGEWQLVGRRHAVL